MKYPFLFPVLMFFSVAYASGQKLPNDELFYGQNVAPNAPSGEGDERIRVDLFSGKPVAGFPLFSYKGPGLRHELSLNYQGGGIQVSQVASNTGLGFTISTGSFIARAVRGLPDDGPYGFPNADTIPVNGTKQQRFAQYARYASESEDSQYDEYFFSAGGASGKFIFGKGGHVITIPDQRIKIEKTYTPSSFSPEPLDSCLNLSFKITLQNGVQYYFSDFDCSRFDYSTNANPNNKQYASSNWYLTRIVAPFNEDSIEFSYLARYHEFARDYAETAYSTVVHDSCATSMVHPEASNRIREMVLGSVSYPDGTLVTFNYDTIPRADLLTDYALKSMILSNAFSGSSYGYKFKYHYTDRYSRTRLPYKDYRDDGWAAVYGPYHYSLMLEAFYPYSGTDSLPGYTFIYSPSVLHPRLGVTDSWGFGTSLSTPFLPAIDPTDCSIAPGLRAPDIAFATGCSITGIELPAGGRITFDYELHSVKTGPAASRNIGGIRVRKMTSHDGLNHNNDLITEYRYVEEDGITSSGVMINEPVYTYTYRQLDIDGMNLWSYITPMPVKVMNDLTEGLTADIVVRSSVPLNDFKFIKGSPAAYRRVEEYEGGVTGFKKKNVYEFSVPADFPVPANLTSNTFPFPQYADVDVASGLPLSIRRYNASGILESKTLNEYRIDPIAFDNRYFRAVKVGIRHYPFSEYGDLSIARYYPYSAGIYHTKTREVTYYAHGDSTEYTTETVYDTVYQVPKRTITRNALHEPVEQRYYYPYEFNIPGAIDLLKSKGLVYTPLRTETWRMGGTPQLLDASVTDYDLYDGHPRPASLWQLTPDQVVNSGLWGSFDPEDLWGNQQFLTRKRSFDRYDRKGNLVQTTSGGIVNSYLFAYNHTAAVAGIGNAGYDDVAYSSFEDHGSGGWVIAGNAQATGSDFFTGQRSLELPFQGSVSRSGLDPSQKYVLTAWTNGSPFRATATTPAGSVTPAVTGMDTYRGWKLYRTEFTNATGIRVDFSFSTHKLDELRLIPEGAAITTRTFDPLSGMTSRTDESNHTVHYEYDRLGRIKYEKDSYGHILKAYDYQFQDRPY